MNDPEALTNWVLSPPPPRPNDAPTGTYPDVAFAHFKGLQATNKSRWFPEFLWATYVSGGQSAISIVHVVARSKLWRLSELRAEHVAEQTARGVIPVTTVDYRGLLRELRASRRNGRWRLQARGPLAPRTVFIIEVDPDFPADFFLALYAAVEFSLSVTEEQTQAVMRLATMSWERADELYSRLVQQTEHDITTLPILGNREPFIHQDVGSEEEKTFQVIISRLESLSLHSDDLHTIVYFQDEYEAPPRWKEDEWEDCGWTRQSFELDHRGRFPAQDEAAGSVILHVPCGIRGFGRLETDGYVHIIPSRTRQRLIFDMQTRQVVRIDVRVSQPERSQQVSWVDRTTCPRSRICVYLDTESRVEHLRRKDILNSQLAGLIAGLAQFEGWSSRIRSLPRLIAVLTQGNEPIRGILDQTVQRLVLQGLLQIQGSGMGPIISLQGGIPNTFSTLLPLVGYDTRLAYLLVQPSDRMTTLVKIQVAAMLTIGQDELVSFRPGLFNPEDREYVDVVMKRGYGANLAPLGTIWMVLGLLKGGKHDMVQKDNARPFVDGKVSIDGPACQEWEARCRELDTVLSPGQDSVDVLEETGTLTEGQVEALYWDCLRAFAFQIGVVTDSRRFVVHDFVSGAKLGFDMSVLMIDFDTIRKNDPECMVGFYTTLSRCKSIPTTTIQDWNWIPSSIWQRWRQHLEANGSHNWTSMANRYQLSRNSDELEYE